jgi:MtrB/PioB family decaheme-associated outer membrane protein
MQVPKKLIAVLLLSALTAGVQAAEGGGEAQPSVDTSKWQCKFCVFEEGRSIELDLGLGAVSQDSFKFGEYTGLNEEGAFLVGNASVRSRRENGSYLDLEATRLGLDARALELEGGKQGKYKLFLDYQEIPHFISDSVRTPFIGSGKDTLTLPAGWVRAGTTGGMTALPGSLREVDLETERRRLALGGAFVVGRKWEYAVKFRHETKEGKERIAGAFFFNGAQLVEPVDYITDELDASATYTRSKFQLRFAYHASLFRNRDESLTWQNPFTGLVLGADTGQLALPPDNQFHQALVSAGYQISKRTRFTADLAAGRGTQDEDFLAPTLNPNLMVGPLSRMSLEGRVDTLTANLRINSTLSDQLQLNAVYAYDDRDNKTPQTTVNWVSTDTFVAGPRTNLPYSFTKSALKLSADYRIATRTKASVGFDYETFKRTFQEVDETQEGTTWGKINARAQDNVDLLLTLAHGKRGRTDYEPVPEVSPSQNPLLRKFNMAHRERDLLGLQTTVTLRENVTIGAGFELATNDYTRSTIGLLDSQELNVNLDSAVMLSEKTSVHFFLNQQRIESKQAGSQTFSTPDWTAKNDDTINTGGLGVRHTVKKDKLEVGADYTLSRSEGEVMVITAVPTTPFPDLTTKLNSLKLYATYRLKKNLSLNAAYWYETYDSDDWQLDGVTPSTIPNVLAFGETSPSYNVSVISLSARYKF